MQYSGVVVTTRRESTAEVAERIESLPGAEVYLRNESSGRIVVVQEAEDVAAHEELFRRIQAMPGVVATELVSHVTDAGPPDPPSATESDQEAS